MKRTKEEAAQTREDLLRAALKVFGAKGYVATRLEDIAKEAKVTRGALYWHFKGKDEIFLELLRSHTTPLLTIIQNAAETSLPPVEKIRHVLKEVLFHLHTNSDSRYAFMLEYERIATSSKMSEFKDALREKTNEHRNTIQAIVEQGKKDGSIRKDYSTDNILSLIGVVITGALMNYRVQHQLENNEIPLDIETLPDLAIEAIIAR